MFRFNIHFYLFNVKLLPSLGCWWSLPMKSKSMIDLLIVGFVGGSLLAFQLYWSACNVCAIWRSLAFNYWPCKFCLISLFKCVLAELACLIIFEVLCRLYSFWFALLVLRQPVLFHNILYSVLFPFFCCVFVFESEVNWMGHNFGNVFSNMFYMMLLVVLIYLKLDCFGHSFLHTFVLKNLIVTSVNIEIFWLYLLQYFLYLEVNFNKEQREWLIC